MLTNESVEIVKSREVTPLIDTIRAKLPMQQIDRTEMIVSSKDFRIENEEGKSVVNDYMRDTATWSAQVTSYWEPVKKFWHSIHAAACAAEKDTAPAIGRIRAACDKAMKDYIHREKLAADSRQRIMAQNTEYMRKQAEKEARAAALRGDTDQAEAMFTSAANMRTPVIMSSEPKLDGTAIKEKFVVTVDDPMALIKAIADGRIPLMHEVMVKGKAEERPLVEFSDSILQYYGSKLGKQFTWPGIKVTEDIGFAVKKR